MLKFVYDIGSVSLGFIHASCAWCMRLHWKVVGWGKFWDSFIYCNAPFYQAAACIKSNPWESSFRIGSVWPDWAKFRQFEEKLKVFGQFLVCLIWYLENFCTFFGTFYATGQILNVLNGQKLINNLAIWSHWSSDQLLKKIWMMTALPIASSQTYRATLSVCTSILNVDCDVFRDVSGNDDDDDVNFDTETIWSFGTLRPTEFLGYGFRTFSAIGLPLRSVSLREIFCDVW